MSESNPPPTSYHILRDAARGVLVVTLLAVGAATALKVCTVCMGCKPPASVQSVPMTAEQSAILGMYAAEMAECRERAIKAHDIAVFDSCADEVDRRYPR